MLFGEMRVWILDGFKKHRDEERYPSYLAGVADCTLPVRSFPRFTPSDDNDVHTYDKVASMHG